jgi:hypothetical protein
VMRPRWPSIGGESIRSVYPTNKYESKILTSPTCSNLSRRIPTLAQLDGTPIVAISFDVSEASTSAAAQPTGAAASTSKSFPFPMQGSLIAGIDQGLVAGFLTKCVISPFHLVDTY